MSGVWCQVSGVRCHLSLTPTATDPSPSYSPTIHSSAAADLDLDPSTMSDKEQNKNFVQHGNFFNR